MNLKFIFSIFSAIVLISLYWTDRQIVEGDTMNNTEKYYVKIIIGDTILSATLENNATARDFISLLPLDLELKDYAGT